MKGLDLKKKVGPLPVWAWGIIFGVAAYYVYSRNKAANTTSTGGATPGILDPNAIDPNTGLTYGAEEGAALNANAGLAGGAGGGTVPTDSNLTTGTNELGDLESFLTEFQNIASLLGYNPPGTGAVPLSTLPKDITGSTPSVNTSTSGQPHNKKKDHHKHMHPLVGKGAVRAPAGPHKPPPKKGFHVRGLGGGAWEYVPNRPAVTKPKPNKTAAAKTKQARTRGAGWQRPKHKKPALAGAKKGRRWG